MHPFFTCVFCLCSRPFYALFTSLLPSCFQDFSPNNVSILRGSYGRGKGRCLIEVPTPKRGIFLVNFRIKWLLCFVHVRFDRAGSHKVWVAVRALTCQFAKKCSRELWHVHVHFDRAGSHKVWVAVLFCTFLRLFWGNFPQKIDFVTCSYAYRPCAGLRKTCGAVLACGISPRGSYRFTCKIVLRLTCPYTFRWRRLGKKLRRVSGARFSCEFSREMALVTCPYAFRLRRLARSVGRGLGIYLGGDILLAKFSRRMVFCEKIMGPPEIWWWSGWNPLKGSLHDHVLVPVSRVGSSSRMPGGSPFWAQAHKK